MMSFLWVSSRHSRPEFVTGFTIGSFLLSISLSFALFSRSEAGLTIDEQQKPQDAVYGDACNVYAYRAFREPTLMIQVRFSGDDEEQKRETSKLHKYNYTDPITRVSQIYSYIPEEFKTLTCAADYTPLMCKETDESNGDGTCVCLEKEVHEDNGGGKSSKSTNHVIWTEPMFNEPSARKVRGKSRKHRDTDQNKITKGTEQNKQGNSRIPNPHVKCLARIHTFCQTPFIRCQPWLVSRNMMDTSCVFSRCKGNSGVVTSPKKIFQLIQIISTLVLLFFLP